MKDGFFQIIFESPPAEVELSTELKCREVMKSNDIDKIKAFCCDLIRNQSKMDTVLASSLARLAEQESRKMVEENNIDVNNKFDKIMSISMMIRINFILLINKFFYIV